MAISRDNQAKAGKNPAEKKVTEKKIKKTPNPSQKRGQPTAAARLISSPWVKFGWHKPLSNETKEVVKHVGSMADSMYMLQVSSCRPIDSLSLRNGIFHEHRQLADPSMVSTPAVDHIDLFPLDDESFEDTMRKIAKQPSEENGKVFLHYLFENLRSREFLLLPFEVCGEWVTIIAKMRPKETCINSADREVTDLAIVDPQPYGRETRRALIIHRLPSILAEGYIQLSNEVTYRHVFVEDLANDPSSHWQSGLVAYAVSREFLRRLKTLQFRSCARGNRGNDDFLWAPFEEHYNFNALRQNLLAACAHQTIEASDYRVRLALEVPSDDSNYQPSVLRPLGGQSYTDEKWEVFQSTHTFTLEGWNQCVVKEVGFTSPNYTSKSVSGPASPACSPTSLGPKKPSSPSSLPPFCAPSSPGYSPASPTVSSPTSNQTPMCADPQVAPISPIGHRSSPRSSGSTAHPEYLLPIFLPTSNQTPTYAGTQVAPVAPMGPDRSLSRSPGSTHTICRLRALSSEPLAEDQAASKKRRLSEDSDVEEPPMKKLKTGDKS